MNYRMLLFVSALIFAFLSLTIGVAVYSQRQRPRENRGTPACTIQIESSGA